MMMQSAMFLNLSPGSHDMGKCAHPYVHLWWKAFGGNEVTCLYSCCATADHMNLPCYPRSMPVVLPTDLITWLLEKNLFPQIKFEELKRFWAHARAHQVPWLDAARMIGRTPSTCGETTHNTMKEVANS